MSPNLRSLLYLGALTFSSHSLTAADFTFQVLATNLPPGDASRANPSLIQGKDGSFYGTSYQGGPYGMGGIYRVSPGGGLTTLMDFAGTNGLRPTKGLTQGKDGNFYGVTPEIYVPKQYPYFATNPGSVFRMTPTGAFTTIYSFTNAPGQGITPSTRLLEGTDGNFYGATAYGGTNANGTIYRISPTGVLTTLTAFPGAYSYPVYPNDLIQAKDGNFYGTTQAGGTNRAGSVFRMNPGGAITNLFSFGGTKGANPEAALVQAQDGNFYGTTKNGYLATQPFQLYAGTVFKITPDGVLTTLGLFDTNNGAWPIAPLVQGLDGNLYGACEDGGSAFRGTLFKVTPGGVFSTLLLFEGVNGSNPLGGLVLGQDGNLYGSTAKSNAGPGVFFRLGVNPVVPQAQTITFPAVGVVNPSQQIKLAATASSGLAVSYKVVSGPGMVFNGTLSFLGDGTVKVVASQPGNPVFKPAKDVAINVSVRKVAQTLSPFKVIPTQTYSGAWFSIQTPTPVASSGLPVTVAVKSGSAHVTTDSNAPPANASVIITGLGPVTLTAEQAGNATIAPAKTISTSFAVKANQTITFPALPPLKVGLAVQLKATASSGLPVTYSISGPALLSTNSLFITGPGLIGIGAHQNGNGLYFPAPLVKQSVNVK